MAYTDINSEDRLVQATFAEYLESQLGWDSVYAWNNETFGPDGTLGRLDTLEAVFERELRAALRRLNPQLPIRRSKKPSQSSLATTCLAHYSSTTRSSMA